MNKTFFLGVSALALGLLFFLKPEPVLALPSFPSVPKCSLWYKLTNNTRPAGETCCDSCGNSCGGLCVSTSRYCVNWSYRCAIGGGSFIPASDYCKADSSCNVSNYQLCDNQSCGVWINKGCGEWNCSFSQMYQSKTCVDSTNNSYYCSLQHQCVDSSACQATPPSCYTSGTSCASRGGSCGNYTSSNCNGTVRTGLCPGGSSCVCCVPSSGGGGGGPTPPPPGQLLPITG